MIKAVVSKTEIESALAKRFGSVAAPHEKLSAETLSSGISEIDALGEGFPRGAITEMFGLASSGRTSALVSALAHATSHEELCVLIDVSDAFDSASATRARVDLDRLLWIRCAADIERAFKATDLVLQSGGFGLVVLDMADVGSQYARRIISSWWYRFRRTIENTRTALVVISQVSCVRSCSLVSLKLRNKCAAWTRTAQLICETYSVEPDESDDREQPGQSRPQLSVINESVRQHQRAEVASGHSLLFRGTVVHLDRVKPVSAENSSDFRTRLVMNSH